MPHNPQPPTDTRTKRAPREARLAPPFLKGGLGGISAWLLAVCLLAACGQEAPEPQPIDEARAPVEARSKVDRAVATTGDVITYTVIVDHDPAYEVDLPEPGADIAGFRITDIGTEEPRDERGRRIQERWYKLRADLVGSYILPPVAVTYRPASGPETTQPETTQPETTGFTPLAPEDQTLQTSEIFIEVQSVLPGEGEGEATDIRDVKPLRQIVRPTPWWWFAAGGGAVLAALLLGFWLWRRSQRVSFVPPRPAHEVAFEALERLRHTDFQDPEAVRLFHFEISEVLRAYVEGRFNLNATDLTTEEIAEQLDEVRGLHRDQSQSLRTFLGATDQVKFAAYLPTEEEIGQTYEAALSFVEATRPRPEDVQADDDGDPGTPPPEDTPPPPPVDTTKDASSKGEALAA